MIIDSMPVVLQITIHDKTVGPNLWQVCFHFPLVLQLLSVCCLNKWSSRLSISMDRSHHCLTHKQYIHINSCLFTLSPQNNLLRTVWASAKVETCLIHGEENSWHNGPLYLAKQFFEQPESVGNHCDWKYANRF